jgi:quinol monooxygenase YgiN
MENEIYSIYHLTLNPADYDKFRALVLKIVDLAKEEPDTLTYEYVVNAERTQAHIVERYRMPGLLPHVEQTFAPFAEEFLLLCKIDALFVYGQPTPDIRAKLDGFGARYFESFAGFAR